MSNKTGIGFLIVGEFAQSSFVSQLLSQSSANKHRSGQVCTIILQCLSGQTYGRGCLGGHGAMQPNHAGASRQEPRWNCSAGTEYRSGCQNVCRTRKGFCPMSWRSQPGCLCPPCTCMDIDGTCNSDKMRWVSMVNGKKHYTEIGYPHCNFRQNKCRCDFKEPEEVENAADWHQTARRNPQFLLPPESSFLHSADHSADESEMDD